MKTTLCPFLVGVLVFPLVVGCSPSPVTGRKQLVLISTQQEIALGADAAPQFESQLGGKVPNRTLQNYVSRLGQKVAAQSERKGIPYEFALLGSDVPNAFALPGGKIYVTAGLMRRLTHQRQLAAVLSHEVTHVAARHNVMGIQRQLGSAVLVELAGWAAGEDKQKTAQAAAQITTSMFYLRYSRSDEYEADKHGLRYMTRAGHNPWGMIELLETLQRLNDSEPGLLGEMFRTHPATGKRIEQVKEIIEQDESYRRYRNSRPATAKSPRFNRMLKLLE